MSCKRSNTDHTIVNRLYENEAYQEIIAMYDERKAEFNKDPYLLNKLGMSYHELGEYNKAIDTYNQALDLDNNMSMTYSNRGLSEVEIGEYIDATNSCNQAIELDHENFNGYLNRSYASIKLKKWDWALEDLERATALKGVSRKKMGFAYANLGTVYINTGEDEKALEYTQKAIRANRKIPWAFECSAYLKIKAQKTDEALVDIDEGLRLDSKNKTLLQYKGLLLIKTGQLNEGCECLFNAKELMKDFEEERFKLVSESIKKYCI